ncbi:MAG: hypothetical protein HQ546_02340 [Planctomycetes bacterium]|nr:hypothetical protein [Planctomycetota bacterium]
MRIAFVIVILAVIAASLVTFRSQEAVTRHEIQCLQAQLIEQRHGQWDLDVSLGVLTAVEAVRERADKMGLTLVPPGTQEGPQDWASVLALESSD